MRLLNQAQPFRCHTEGTLTFVVVVAVAAATASFWRPIVVLVIVVVGAFAVFVVVFVVCVVVASVIVALVVGCCASCALIDCVIFVAVPIGLLFYLYLRVRCSGGRCGCRLEQSLMMRLVAVMMRAVARIQR